MLSRACKRIAWNRKKYQFGTATVSRCFSAAASRPKVVVARGDGIGPEIMESTLQVIEAAGVDMDVTEIEVGQKLYEAGYSSGIAPESWEAIEDAGVLLKAPIMTPSGGGYKSLNVSIRKTLGLFANVRPVRSLHPFVKTKHPQMDLVIVRENEESLYSAVEHRGSNEVYQTLKLVSVPGTERIVRYAFDYASKHGRKKVSCLHKANIMKGTDGLFARLFEEIGELEFPEIERESLIVDIGMARLADTPERFDVIVTENLYGDIASDVASQIAGSVGLSGSANVGSKVAMFEAIHGSAPDIAGKDMANPSGLIEAAIQMLVHLGHVDAACDAHNALMATIEDGIHTADIFDDSEARQVPSKKLVGTKAFTEALVERIAAKATPKHLPMASFSSLDQSTIADSDGASTKHAWTAPKETKSFHGIDMFVQFDEDNRNPDKLAADLNAVASKVPSMELRLITNRGVKVWPNYNPNTFCTDHWRCRFRAKAGPTASVDPADIATLYNALTAANFDVVKSETLYIYTNDETGKEDLGFSLGQGE